MSKRTSFEGLLRSIERQLDEKDAQIAKLLAQVESKKKEKQKLLEQVRRLLEKRFEPAKVEGDYEGKRPGKSETVKVKHPPSNTDPEGRKRRWSPLYRRFRKFVIEMREQEYSYSEIAPEFGVSSNAVHNWYLGKNTPTHEHMDVIEKRLRAG